MAMDAESKESQEEKSPKFVSEELCVKAIDMIEHWIGEGYTPAQVLSSLEVAKSLILLSFSGKV